MKSGERERARERKREREKERERGREGERGRFALYRSRRGACVPLWANQGKGASGINFAEAKVSGGSPTIWDRAIGFRLEMGRGGGAVPHLGVPQKAFSRERAFANKRESHGTRAQSKGTGPEFWAQNGTAFKEVRELFENLDPLGGVDRGGVEIQNEALGRG